MKLENNQLVYIQSYKHDGTLHRTWAKGYVVTSSEDAFIVVTYKTLVSESDGRKWLTREPAVYFLYTHRWYNVIAMIRNDGIHYYCNLASPSLYDGEAVKNIDYDLDMKVNPQGKIKLLDENEYQIHIEKMQYSRDLQTAIAKACEQLRGDIENKRSPFDPLEVEQIYAKYLKQVSRD